MLQKLGHIHFAHYIETVLFFSEMKDRLAHEFVENEDIVLKFKVATKGIDKVSFEKRAFGDEGVDLAFLYFPAYSINEEGSFDGVELRNHWV